MQCRAGFRLDACIGRICFGAESCKCDGHTRFYEGMDTFYSAEDCFLDFAAIVYGLPLSTGLGGSQPGSARLS